MNFFTILLMLLIFGSLNSFAFHHERSHYSDQYVARLARSPENLDSLDVQVKFRNFDTRDKAKVNSAVEILKKVVNSPEFKERVLSFSFEGQNQFYQNNGMSNQEIYDLIMSGEEILMPSADHVMNFDLTLYRSWNPFSKVKGYTLPDTMRIWINKKFFRKQSWSEVDVAANMAHEWVHKIGFGHDYYFTPDRPYSVPYAIGNIVADVANLMGYE